jgi:hypothetical protein
MARLAVCILLDATDGISEGTIARVLGHATGDQVGRLFRFESQLMILNPAVQRRILRAISLRAIDNSIQ